jgi:hypothetical protein
LIILLPPPSLAILTTISAQQKKLGEVGDGLTNSLIEQLYQNQQRERPVANQPNQQTMTQHFEFSPYSTRSPAYSRDSFGDVGGDFGSNVEPVRGVAKSRAGSSYDLGPSGSYLSDRDRNFRLGYYDRVSLPNFSDYRPGNLFGRQIGSNPFGRNVRPPFF